MRRKILKWVVRITVYGLLSLILLITGFYYILKIHFPPELVRSEVAGRITEWIGRPVFVRKIELIFLPLPAFIASDVEILNPEGKPMLMASQVRIIVLPKNYKTKELHIPQIALIEPRINLTVEGTRIPDLQSLIGEINQKMKSSPKIKWKATLNRLTIENGIIEIADQRRTKKLKLLLKGNIYIYPEDPYLTLAISGGIADLNEGGFYQIEGHAGGESHFSLNIHHLPILTLSKYVPALAPLKGNANLAGNIHRDLKGIWNWSLEGALEQLEFTTIVSRAKGTALFSLSRDHPIKMDVEVEGEKTQAALSMIIPDYKNKSGIFKFVSGKFDLNEIAIWSAPFKSTAPFNHPWTWSGSAQVSSGTLGNFSFTDFRSEIQISSSLWKFAHADFSALGGKVESDFSIEGSSFNKIVFKGKARGIESNQLFKIWHSSNVYGTSNMDVDVKGPLSDHFLAQGSGKIDFRITNGYLDHFPTFLKILSSLNLKGVIEAKAGRDHLETFAFRHLGGKLKIENGKMITQDFVLQSDTLVMKMIGSMDFAAQSIDAKVSVQALMYLDEIIKNIPLLRKIYGNKMSMIPLWAGIKGHLKELEIFPFQIKEPAIEGQRTNP